ncbi:G-type lectin S-receptor-like serine/threonine-protein kinase LECRK3 [Salvia hispanica]|uniref:G-type lectin S-receptor-like serine/threonine-protein kinase LECRK3 n=1 Tax=Salvia hispanica TaxID=49212 RepID=UPI00200996DA|nr:G-type lectin S-receptor-like serine/threonine-protein kinase LECRK3 [Salvia hispanica]
MGSWPSRRDIMLFITTIMLVLPTLATAQPRTNVTLGSSLVANSANSTWLSPSSEFAFGFQRAAPKGGYLLAIWFHQIPEKTIIWSANRDDLAPEGSRLQLAANGRLQLTDPSGRQIWAAGSGNTSYAAMLDTGNFVLFTAASASLWQTFDQPTDTLVPTQILNQGGELVSSFSDKNFSRGRFILTMQNDGNLTLNTRNVLMSSNVRIGEYWSTKTQGVGFRLIFNETGYFNLVAQNRTLLNNLFLNIGASTRHYYQRLTLEYDGVLRHYLYPKSHNWTDGRSMAWSVQDYLPSNICTDITQRTGGGACGFNSLCTMGNDRRPQCSCPSDYSFIDPNDLWSGCKKDFLPHSCDPELQEQNLFMLKDIPNADWSGADYAGFSPVSEDWCRHQCLTDCFCDVVVYRRANCWMKRFPFSNGRIDSRITGKALIKVRARNATLLGNKPGKRNRSGLIIAGAVLLATSVFLYVLLFASKAFLVGRKSEKIEDEGRRGYPGLNIRCFSFKELEEATNGFSQELGKGAYSTVYKGSLIDENGKMIAVKKLTKMADDADQEFKAEVSSISRTNHKNLVQLLGYCDEGQNRLLVYEYMSNGSLANVLFADSLKPNWHTRLQIAFSVARGICYLHEDCSTQIIHCDIKPQNVLLDDAHTAKISDFGLAKLLKADQTRTMTGIRGTRGYVAPEWFRNMPITVKVDVYSYGVLLLELLCCRKNFDPDIEGERRILSDWAYDCCCDGTVEEMVVEDEEMRDDMMRFEKMVKIAMWCIQEDPELRPQMKRVVHMLEGSAQVPPPPDPSTPLL